MLNKKGAEAVGISPMKMIVSFILIIFLLIILILSLNALKDANKKKTDFLVESVVARDRVFDIFNRKVDYVPIPNILQGIFDDKESWSRDYMKGPIQYPADKENIQEPLRGELFKAVKASIDEILPVKAVRRS